MSASRSSPTLDILTRGIHVLKRRQLAALNPIHDTLHAVLGYDVGLHGRDAVAGPGVVEQPLGRSRVAHEGQDVALGAQGADDGRDADVARGADDEDGFWHFFW